MALTSRDREAQEEVLRILPLQREAFRAPADWAFQVLAAERHAAAVQRSYRNLMRKLHPDKVAVTEGVERATAMVREAKDLCERSLSKTVAPMPPRCLRPAFQSPWRGEARPRGAENGVSATDSCPFSYLFTVFLRFCRPQR